MIVLRSVLFNLGFFGVTMVMGLLSTPFLVGPRYLTQWMIRVWAKAVVWQLRMICGVRVDLRGMERIPPGAVVLAAKHQSAFDTIIWLALLPDVAYVLKQELMSVPVYGWHVRRSDMIPVDREGGGAALRVMLRKAQQVLADGRQIVIFPEGTRTAPGQRVPYAPGVVAIAGLGTAPVLPVATDSGRVWGRRSFLKQPGVIRISVLEPLPAGLPRAKLLAALEDAIETESDRLLAEGPVYKSVGG